MATPLITSKEVINYFYTKCEGEDYYICKNVNCKSKQKQQQKSGYTNLQNHLRTCIGPNFQDIYLDLVKSSKNKGRLESHGFISRRQIEVFNILNWIIMRNLPISEVDDKDTRSILNTKPISSKTLRKYILALTPHVEKVISEELPDKFGLVFDGWTSGSTHYVAIFATYTKNGIHEEPLLAMAPLVNEEQLGAEQHIEFMNATLHLYSKSMNNVVVLIGDNCSTNKKISNDTNIPLIGCASHRFNLAVNFWLEQKSEFASILVKINELMVQLRQLKNAARLRALTDLCAIKDNVTRWSSKYHMAKRYIMIEKEVSLISELEEYVLVTKERQTLGDLMNHLSKFQSVTTSLQKKGLSTLTVREVFHAMLDENEYPELKTYLAADADIVNNPEFESGLNKIVGRTHLSMTENERVVTSCLLRNETSELDEQDDTGTSSYFEMMKKRKRYCLSDEQERYIDCSFCVATSNTVERLFSSCKHILTDLRKHMSPIMFEALIFLKINRKLWDAPMVATAIKNNEVQGVERDLDIFYTY